MKDGTAKIQTWDTLKSFGFQPDSQVISDFTPGLSFDFGDFKLSASAVINQRFAEVILFTSVLITRRTMAEINFEMPRVTSQGQCAACLAWNLDKYLADEPSHRTAPAWLSLGRGNQLLLPWVAEAAHYSARSCCSMDRDSARLILKKLRAALVAAPPETDVVFSFDGEVLKIRCVPELIAAAASGQAWTENYQLSAARLAELPSRLMRDLVEFSVWKNHLIIASHHYAGVTTATQSSRK